MRGGAGGGEPAAAIADYIAAQEETLQGRLRAVYGAVKAALPDAEEGISFRMPALRQGKTRVYFAAFKRHIGLFPGADAVAAFAGRLTGFKTSRGGIQFPHNAPLPLALITDIAAPRGEA